MSHWWRSLIDDLFEDNRRKNYRHHHHRVSVVLVVRGKFAILLKPDEELFIMTDITLGQGLDLSIVYLNQNGQPMAVAPTPDSPPTWSNTTPATETVAASTDGLTAHATSVAVGSDAINMSVTVGGAAFSATLGVNVLAVPDVLTTVEIKATTT